MLRGIKPVGQYGVTSRRHTFRVNASKGFSSSEEKQQQVKLSERGKVSSRPGQISPKQQKKMQAEQAAAASAAEEASRAATATPAAKPAATAAAPRAGRKEVRETPQVVVDRIFKRMLLFTGVPLFTGVAMLPLFYYLKVAQHIDYPLWVVYVAQTITFGGSIAGITYGALSTSWDPTREGSFWGWTELRANVSILLNSKKEA